MKPSALATTIFTCALLALTEAFMKIIPDEKLINLIECRECGRLYFSKTVILRSQPRCQCIQAETVPWEISDDRIMKLEVFQPGPHCKNMEIIATVKFRKEFTLCLNPKYKWVQIILEKRNLTHG